MTDNRYTRRTDQFDYDVCLSFAGEDRNYVRAVADALSPRGVRVFYDEYEEGKLWGKDLFQHLDYIYGSAARFCVVFISCHYAVRLWTNHEIKSAQARAFREKREYILPARFDETELPGIRVTTGYLDLRRRSPEECSKLIIQKLAPYKLLEFQKREHYFPPNPDILYKATHARSERRKRAVNTLGQSFFLALKRMNDGERRAVLTLIVYGCPHDYPNNVHIEIDLLRRIMDISRTRALSWLQNLSSLGFDITICDSTGMTTKNGKYAYLRWTDRSVDPVVRIYRRSLHTQVATEIVKIVSRNYCETHAMEALIRLNFSALSSATAVDDTHL